MSKIHIFCVNTPFQLYIVKTIINNFFKDESKVVVSTLNDCKTENLYFIDNTRIRDVISLKRFIKRNIDNIHFYIPHLGSFFGSYFFSLSCKYNRPINLYYEGIALFYNPKKSNYSAAVKRYLFGLFSGIKYKHYKTLYHQSLINKVEHCYSPISEGLDKYKNVVQIHCDVHITEESKKNDGILLILSPKLSFNDINGIINCLVNSPNKDIIYIKPHFELHEIEINRLCSHMDENGLVYKVIDRSIPIEIIFGKFCFVKIVSQHFSSALINIRLLFRSKVPIEIINKDSIPYAILEKLHLTI